MVLKLQLVQDPRDVPYMVAIYFESCQNNPLSLACWPRIPVVREWWENHVAMGLSRPENVYLKIVDTTGTSCNLSKSKIIAWAKWTKPQPASQAEDYTSVEQNDDPVDLPKGADIALCKEVFGAWDMEKGQILGNRRPWYLEQLFTSPRHQRRGAGGMLMDWGIRNADQDKTEAYLEASGPEGLSLYRKHGFQEVKALNTVISSSNLLEGQQVGFKTSFMIRPPSPL